VLERGWSKAAWEYAVGTWAALDSVTSVKDWKSLRLHAVGGDTKRHETPSSLKFPTPVRSLQELSAHNAEPTFCRGDSRIPLFSALAAPLTGKNPCDTCPGRARTHQLGGVDHLGLLQDHVSHSLVRGLIGEGCSWEGVWKLGGTWLALYQEGTRVHGHLPGTGAGHHFMGVAHHSGQLEGSLGSVDAAAG
jgi:hypothetical protein